MGGRTFQVESVGRDLFLFIFLISGGKNDSPKNNKFSQSMMLFWEKCWKKIFIFFQKIFAFFSLTLTKNGWFYIVLANYQKKKPNKQTNKKPTKMDNLSRSRQ